MQCFQSVARHKSVTKAAEELNYVQSNVTNRLKQLEKELNTELFHRNRRGMTLTHSGRILIRYADQILQWVSDAKNAFHIPQGPLKLGSTESTAAVYLPELLVKFHQHCPDVELSLTTASSEQLMEQVLRHELDGAFIAGPVKHSDLNTTVFVKEELVLISSIHQEPIRTPSDLQDLTLLVFHTGCYYRSLLEQWLRLEGIRPIKRMELGTLDGLLGCVRAGLGVALVSRSVAQNSKQIKLHPLPDDYRYATTVYIQRNDIQQTAAITHFMDLLNHSVDHHSKRKSCP